VQRNKTIGQLIDESLEFYGIKSRESARDLVRRVRARARLTEADALAVAQEEVKAARPARRRYSEQQRDRRRAQGRARLVIAFFDAGALIYLMEGKKPFGSQVCDELAAAAGRHPGLGAT